jgi:hypothetical protein
LLVYEGSNKLIVLPATITPINLLSFIYTKVSIKYLLTFQAIYQHCIGQMNVGEFGTKLHTGSTPHKQALLFTNTACAANWKRCIKIDDPLKTPIASCRSALQTARQRAAN